MPNARATVATRDPIWPSPTSPSVAPARFVPIVLCHGPPAWKAAFSTATLRTSPRISAHVSSTVDALLLPVPQTTTPARAAAARSTAALRMPEVTSSRSFGSRSTSDAGNGVRSRMITTMSKPASAATTASSLSWCSRNTVTSTRPSSRPQPAVDSATSW
jgi:hypothetical protein